MTTTEQDEHDAALTATPPPPPTLADLRALRDAIGRLERHSDADAVDQIRFLEELKAVASAGQAVASADLAERREADEEMRGIPADERGRGLKAEVALARNDSPSRGDQHLGLARALVHELPRTLDLMSQGLVSEWRATILAQETAGLTPEDRREVDAALAPDLPGWGDKQVRRHARKAAQEREEDAAELRRLREKRQRHVSIRPATGSMARVTALLPMTEAVRVHASLLKQAASIVTAGDADGRTPGQIAADLLVEHVTGTPSSAPRDVDLTIVMTGETLAGGRESAWLPGQGPLPAQAARDHVREAGRVWFRRLWTDPATGGVVSLESQGRTFEGGLRRLILMRDDLCTEPFCNAPIQHVDHVVEHARGGATSAANGTGLCAEHYYLKIRPGWRHEVDEAGESAEIRTPTGHRYRRSRSPFPYRRPATPPPEMTRERYEALRQRVAERVRRPDDRPSRTDSGSSTGGPSGGDPPDPDQPGD
ncbi:HNH endonuclease [Georgenia sp. Z1344]|uniref:HNH endonuclease n=1 Tax=Georgenia sp. Z1344 TaxID=3416706 RepID=UPI003CF4DFDE